MHLLVALIIFIFGAIIGSFLNVVIFRYNTGKSSLSGRSQCFTCGHRLVWYELVPIFSFLLQRGRCRSCLGKISWQYPLVEVVTGLIFLLTATQFLTPLVVLFYWVIFSVLIIIAVYDIRHKIIPDLFVYIFIVLALLGSMFKPSHLLAALLFFLFFWTLWYFSAGRWMGFGDAKLAIGIGLLLGLSRGLSAIIIAFWLGAVIGLILVAGSSLKQLSRRRKSLTMKSEIPFAPFLVAGIIINLLFTIDVILW